MHSVQLDFPASLSTEALLGTIAELNADESIHGILVQLPLPDQDEERVLNASHPRRTWTDCIRLISVACSGEKKVLALARRTASRKYCSAVA